MFKIILFVSSALIFSACGGSNSSSGGGSNTPPPPPEQSIQMEISKVYTVTPGSILKKDGNDTVVKIGHSTDINISTVELLSGSATLTVKN